MNDHTRAYNHHRAPELVVRDDTGMYIHPEIKQAALSINPSVGIALGMENMYFRFETSEESDRFHLFVYEWLMSILRHRAEGWAI
jgi:hypothetical protein